MRVVIFTTIPAIEETPWWRLICSTPGVDAVLLVRRVSAPGLAAMLRRLRANVARHGIIFLPYRGALVMMALAARFLGRRRPAAQPLPAIAVETIEATDVHGESVLARVRAFAPDLGLSVGAPVLREPLFSIPARGTINVHSGRVPEFRGAPPGFWELHQGAQKIGATIHWVNAGLDTGPVIRAASVPIHATDTLADVEARVAELAQRLLSNVLHAIAGGVQVEGCPQPSGGRTFRLPTIGERWRLALRRAPAHMRRTLFAPEWVAKNIAAIALLSLVRPLRDLWRTVAARHPVRFFTYHRVTELCRDGMTIGPAAFDRQVAYVARTHEVVSLERAMALLKSEARLRRPVAVLTFDDAYESVASAAAPILAARGLVATIFVCPDLIGTARRFAHDEQLAAREFVPCMDWAQLTALRDAGWSIGAHTANHVRLSTTHADALRDELERPLVELRARFAIDSMVLAYPFGQPGDISPEALAVARAAGYVAVLSDFGGDATPGTGNGYEWCRWDIGGDHAMLAWRSQVRGFDLRRWRLLVASALRTAG